MNTGFIKRYIDADMVFTIQAHEMLHAEQRRNKVTKFEVGDKVVPKESAYGLTGKMGIIEKRGLMYDWIVVFENEVREPFDEEDLVHFEEEEMTKETKPKYFRGQPLITKDGDEVTYLYDDGDNFWPVRVLNENKDDTDYLNYTQLEPSNDFTFSQVVAGLEQKYFEKGTRFTVGTDEFEVASSLAGLGLVRKDCGHLVSAQISSANINGTWTLVSEPNQKVLREPLKEMTLDEIEELLGHKVKIKNND